MTKYTLLRGMGLMLVVGMVAGCATAPMQEMSDARQAVQAAREAGATLHTPVAMDNAERDLSQAENKLRKRDYDSARDEALAAKQQAVKTRNMALAISQAKEAMVKAEQMGVAMQTARDWLSQAEAASAAGNEEEALRTAQQARQEAQDGMLRLQEEKLRAEREKLLAEQVNQEWLGKVPPLLDEARQAADRLSDEQREALREGEEAYREKQGRKAYELVNPVVEAVRALPPLKQMQQYKVAAGDTLWRIAARKAVYGNPWWWPLIYLSNQDKLPDPQGLNAAMVLDIDMNPSADLVDLAVQYAHRRQGAKGDLKKLDRQFLREAKEAK